MLVSEVRRMSKIKRGILFIVILAVFLVTSSVGMEYYVVHQLNGEVTGRNRPFAALTVEPEDTLDLLVIGKAIFPCLQCGCGKIRELQLMFVDREHREFQKLIIC